MTLIPHDGVVVVRKIPGRHSFIIPVVVLRNGGPLIFDSVPVNIPRLIILLRECVPCDPSILRTGPVLPTTVWIFNSMVIVYRILIRLAIEIPVVSIISVALLVLNNRVRPSLVLYRALFQVTCIRVVPVSALVPPVVISAYCSRI